MQSSYASKLPYMKCEFIMNMLGKVATEIDRTDEDRLITILYLLEENVFKKRYNTTIGYEFDEFSPSCPEDRRFTSDLNAWTTLGFIKGRCENIRLDKDGEKIYKMSVIDKELAKLFGGKEELEFVRGKFREYLSKPDKELFNEAYDLWMERHPEKKRELETLLQRLN